MHIHTVDTYLDEDFKNSVLAHVPQAQKELQKIVDKTCLGHEWTGWYHWPKHSGFQSLKDIKRSFETLDIHYDLVVVIGIGGSYAGTKAVVDAINHSYPQFKSSNHSHKPVVYAGHNLCESQLVELFEILAYRNPVINIISKSGTTTEPHVAFKLINQFIEKKYDKDEARKRIIITTDSDKGALRDLCKEKKYLSFSVPQDVGGRYSVLTPVGLVPLALAGYDVSAMLNGADTCFASLDDWNGSEIHPAIYTACVRKTAWDLGKNIEILSYSNPKLSSLVEWWKQLFGESEGKEGKGLFPAGMMYSTDLHSLGQYLQDGPASMLETFLTVKDQAAYDQSGLQKRLKLHSQMSDSKDHFDFLNGRFVGDIDAAAIQASQMAHSSRGVPVFEISIPKIDEFYLGYLFAFFQVVCGISAALLKVNPYDQPGVEAYKKNLFMLLGRS